MGVGALPTIKCTVFYVFTFFLAGQAYVLTREQREEREQNQER
jgi:cbb3-type cytochrome oxidase subunit 3